MQQNWWISQTFCWAKEVGSKRMHATSFSLYTILEKANYSERKQVSDYLELGVLDSKN